MNRSVLSILPIIAALAACSEPAQNTATLKPPPAPVEAPNVSARAPAAVALTPAPTPTATAPDSPVAQAINQAELTAAETTTAAPAPAARAAAGTLAYDPVLLRAQILLDRARFAPGVIDGRNGENVRQALAAYERTNGLQADGKLDPEVWTRLTADSGPTVVTYTLTPQDVAGPFVGAIPKDMKEQANLDTLGYTDAAEAIGEKFHMDPKLLKALNPDTDFAAGATILVAAPRTGELPEVASIEIDKTERALRAYDGFGRLVAVYPASVGSAERPAPDGTWAVNAVAPRPVYYYDPKRLTFGKDEAGGKLKIAAGPNNPVGSTWIDLTKDTYGIHGSPDPEIIGKRQSHGCVRLTNWDAAELGKAVRKGTKVTFLGADAAKKA